MGDLKVQDLMSVRTLFIQAIVKLNSLNGTNLEAFEQCFENYQESHNIIDLLTVWIKATEGLLNCGFLTETLAILAKVIKEERDSPRV